jgi:hypothetical protein
MTEELKKEDVLKGKVEVAPDLTLNIDLTADHLVDLQVSMTEEALLKEEEALIEKIKALGKLAGEKSAAINKECELPAREEEKRLAFLVKALKAAGFPKPEVKCSFDVFAKEGKIAGNLTTSVVIAGQDRLDTSRKTKVPADIQKFHDEIEALEKERGELSNTLIKIKSNLANIARMERAARAKLAMRALESTPAGRQLLTKLSPQKMLTGPKA